MLAILGGLLSILFGLMVWCFWAALKLAIEIVNCSADFLAKTKRLMAVPFMYYLFLFLFFLYWLACVISVESMGKIEANPNGTPYMPMGKKVRWDDRKD